MSAELAELVADWGAPVLALITFLSCLALPVPASFAMLAAGAFTATGELSLASVCLAAFLGAMLGDLAGFAIGRSGRGPMTGFLATRPRRRRLFLRARALTDRLGGTGVFLSRWLVSPLGPYTNLAAGLTGMASTRFVLWAAAGEAVWVLLYCGLGRFFADQVEMIGDFASSLTGLAAGLALMALTGFWMARSRRRPHPA